MLAGYKSWQATLTTWLMALCCISWTCAERIIEASSLFTCMDNSLVSANYFTVTFTPANRTLSYDISITSEVQGYVLAEIEVYAYGIKVITETIDPCTTDIGSFCPLTPGALEIQSSTVISEDIANKIPGVAYTVPNIDATVIVQIRNTSSTTLYACIEADLTNRKTVEHIAVKWVTAVISGIGLLTSAVVATLGSSLSSAQIAAHAVSLFAYFQSVVIITMCAVDKVPPIASAWAQNLAWSVGIIKVEFMQKIFRWYVQATGGTPDTYIIQPTISVLVQKRNVLVTSAMKITHHTRDLLHAMARTLVSRDTTGYSSSPQTSDTLLVMRGIERVAYQAGIENSSVVLTAFTFFVLICLVICICFVLFYGLIVLLRRSQKMPSGRFVYFEIHWRVMLKGTILRILFIACPSLLVFSMWELIQRNSAAVIVLAVFFLILSLGILSWSIFRVYIIGRESQNKYGTPAVMFFSDTRVLHRYGVLYIPLNAAAYAFLIPILGYIFVKACFVGFAQGSGKTQAMALFILELAFFILLCRWRPYMDKKTNGINIAIGTVMLVNSLFFVFFSEIFHQPRAVASIMGVIFFVLNAAFSLILLVLILFTCTRALLSKHPDSRYKPVQDDRASFIHEPKKANSAASEFTALGIAMCADHDEAFMPLSEKYHSGISNDSPRLGGQSSTFSKDSYSTYPKYDGTGMHMMDKTSLNSLYSSNSLAKHVTPSVFTTEGSPDLTTDTAVPGSLNFEAGSATDEERAHLHNNATGQTNKRDEPGFTNKRKNA